VNELTQDSLEDVLLKIRKYTVETGEKLTLKPKHLLVRPSDLEALGFTVADIQKMIKKEKT
jgi:phage major head subunit gpT-like protein